MSWGGYLHVRIAVKGITQFLPPLVRSKQTCSPSPAQTQISSPSPVQKNFSLSMFMSKTNFCSPSWAKSFNHFHFPQETRHRQPRQEPTHYICGRAVSIADRRNAQSFCESWEGLWLHPLAIESPCKYQLIVRRNALGAVSIAVRRNAQSCCDSPARLFHS